MKKIQPKEEVENISTGKAVSDFKTKEQQEDQVFKHMLLWLAAAAPVLCNAIIVGLVLHFTLADALLFPTILSVGLGEAVVVYALGVSMILAFKRSPRMLQLAEDPQQNVK